MLAPPPTEERVLDERLKPPNERLLDDELLPPNERLLDDELLPPNERLLDEELLPPNERLLDDELLPPNERLLDEEMLPPNERLLDEELLPPNDEELVDLLPPKVRVGVLLDVELFTRLFVELPLVGVKVRLGVVVDELPPNLNPPLLLGLPFTDVEPLFVLLRVLLPRSPLPKCLLPMACP